MNVSISCARIELLVQLIGHCGKQQYFTMLERGARKNPSLPVRKRLSKALGAPVTESLQ